MSSKADNLTPAEREEFLALSGGLTPEEYEEMQQLEAELGLPQEVAVAKPTATDYAKDVGATVLKAAMNATEGGLDLLGLPGSTAQRLYAGGKAAFDDDPATSFWGAATQTPPFGQATRDLFAPAHEALDQFRMDDKSVSKPYEMGRRGADIALPILMSGGAGPARTAGQKAFQKGVQWSGGMAGLGGVVGHEVAGDTGEVAGSLLGGVVGNPAALANFVFQKSRGAYQFFKPGNLQPESASPSAVRHALREYFKAAFPHENPPPGYVDKAIAAAMRKLDDGEQGTFAQLVDDPGLRVTEEAVANKLGNNNSLRGVDVEIRQDAQQRVADVVPGGDPTKARDPVLTRTRAATEGIAAREARHIDDAITQARTALDDATAAQTGFYDDLDIKTLNEANPGGQLFKQSKRITEGGRAGFKQLEDNIAQAYDTAWNKAGILKTKTYNRMLEHLEGLQETDPDTYRRVKKALEGVGTIESPSRTSASVKSAGKVINDEIGRVPFDAYDTREALKGLRQILMDDMPIDGRKRLQQLNANYDKFLTIRGARDATITDTPTLAKTLESKSRSVAPTGAAARGDAPMQDMLGAATAKEAELKAGVSTAQSQLSKAEKAANAKTTPLERARKSVEGTPAGKFAKNEPDEYLAGARAVWTKGGGKKGGGVTPAANMAQILKSAKTPAQRENIRRAFLEEFQDAIFKLDPDKTPDSTSMLQAFKRRRAAYEKSGMFSKTELDTMQAGIEQLKKLKLTDAAAKLEASPIETPRWKKTLAGLVGVFTGGAATGGSHALLVAGRSRKIAEEIADKVGGGKTRSLIYEMTTNPARYRKLFERYGDELDTATGRSNLIAEILSHGGIAAAQTQVQE